MINRYAREEMQALFTDEYRYKTWLDVELASTEAFVEFGVVPREDYLKLRKNASFDIHRILEIEKETRHDVVAFTRAVSETCGLEKRWVHYGLTSTDVVDTAYAVIYSHANDIIQEGLESLLETIKMRAIETKHLPCIGRTHGIHADITSFGLKFALWYDELTRGLERFKNARKEIETGKISGAVGNFANTKPFIQDYVCKSLGIQSAPISTQVLQRDRHASYISSLALISSCVEQMAVEIRHLQRTEVGEVEESFGKGQKGSSAMPHKRNPIGSENISGCARVIRGYMLTSFENIPLWHERDISHSSAERIIFPDAIMLFDYMIHRFERLVKNLVIHEERVKLNIELTHGVIYAQRVMTILIDETTLSREDAYDFVQPFAMIAYQEHTPFRNLLIEDGKILKMISKEKFDEAFNINYFLTEVDTIFERVKIYG